MMQNVGLPGSLKKWFLLPEKYHFFSIVGGNQKCEIVSNLLLYIWWKPVIKMLGGLP